MVNLPLKGRKESIEDLHLFRELIKREKERTSCFLHPVLSHEFEHSNGNSSFYRLHSKKKESGFEFLSENSKSDYDWLKTPPATPLFPSFEMEATAPHLIVQREIPLLHTLTLSQGWSNSDTGKRSSEIAKSAPSREKLPSRLRINSSTEPKNTRRTTTPTPNQRTIRTPPDPTSKRSNQISNNIKSINPKQIFNDYLHSNLSKAPTSAKSNPNPRSRTTSPLVRSTVASQILKFSDETPTNLRIDRSSSVTRGRKFHQTTSVCEKSEQINRIRQSCSPSLMRGRKVEGKKEIRGVNSSDDRKRSVAGAGNETRNVVGSRIVEKLMNARKENGGEEKNGKPELQRRCGISENSRVTRFTTKNQKQLMN